MREWVSVTDYGDGLTLTYGLVVEVSVALIC